MRKKFGLIVLNEQNIGKMLSRSVMNFMIGVKKTNRKLITVTANLVKIRMNGMKMTKKIPNGMKIMTLVIMKIPMV